MNTAGATVEFAEPIAHIESALSSFPKDVVEHPAEGLEGHLNRYGGDITQCPVLRNIGESALAKIQAEVADITDKADQFKGLSIDDLLTNSKDTVQQETVVAAEKVVASKAVIAEQITVSADALIEELRSQTAELQTTLTAEHATITNLVETSEIAISGHSDVVSKNSTVQPPIESKQVPVEKHQTVIADDLVYEDTPVIMQETSNVLEVLASTRTEDAIAPYHETQPDERVQTVSNVEPPESGVDAVLDSSEEYPSDESQAYLEVTETSEVSENATAEPDEVQITDQTGTEPHTTVWLIENMCSPEVYDQLQETGHYEQMIEVIDSEVSRLTAELILLDTEYLNEMLSEKSADIVQMLVTRYELDETTNEILRNVIQRKFKDILHIDSRESVQQDLLNNLGTTEYRFYKAQTFAHHHPQRRLHRVSRNIMLLLKNQELAVA